MSQIDERSWLSALPMVGYDVTVLLKDNTARKVPFGRISANGEVVHINLILEPAENGQFPSIGKTLEISENDISEITLKKEKGSAETTRLVKPDTRWLRNLPKSRKCRIFLFCNDRDHCKEIYKGWIEYDDKKIYLNEILLENKKRLEIDRHERYLNEIIAILVSVDSQTPQVFVRTTKT